jgi:hypothetical protein
MPESNNSNTGLTPADVSPWDVFKDEINTLDNKK